MIYQDLREFIAEVEKVGMLRHVHGANPHLEIGGITEVAAGLPECPALLFDDRRISGRIPRLHQRDQHAAARGISAGNRSQAATGRGSSGVDEEAANSQDAPAGDREGRCIS